MRTTPFCIRALFLSSALFFLAVPAARAAYIISVQQNGSDVDTTGSGSIDYTDLSFFSSASTKPQMQPNVGTLWIGPTTVEANSTDYAGISGPSSFGPGSTTDASNGAGSFVGVFASGNQLLVPQGYISGAPLGTTLDIYSGQTLSSLGLTIGAYTYTWGTGPDADSLTINIGVTPEPTSLGLLALGGIALLRRRQRAAA